MTGGAEGYAGGLGNSCRRKKVVILIIILSLSLELIILISAWTQKLFSPKKFAREMDNPNIKYVSLISSKTFLACLFLSLVSPTFHVPLLPYLQFPSLPLIPT
jgi:hypothetical protein